MANLRWYMTIEPIRRAIAEDGQRWVRMLATTKDSETVPDLDNQRTRQSGVNIEYHVSEGFFTDDHDELVRDGAGMPLLNQHGEPIVIPKARVGEPRAAALTDEGWEVVGVWYQGSPNDPPLSSGSRADYWWNLMETMERSGSNRRVGCSVDGSAMVSKAPDGCEDIIECYIQNIAVTLSPKRPNTYVEIIKSVHAASLLGADARFLDNPLIAARQYEMEPGFMSPDGAVAFLKSFYGLPEEQARLCAANARAAQH